THFIPVVMITALDSPADRVRGLEAGADDFLTKPVSDIVLIARVRSLTRLKMMTDELRMRAITSLEIGVQAPERSAVTDNGKGGHILLVDDRPSSYERLVPVLRGEHTVDLQSQPSEALFQAAEGNYDLLIVSLGLRNFDGLRLCSQARSLERTRHVPILAIADADNNARLLGGLEIGVNDDVLREFAVRVRKSIRGIDLACRYGGEEFVIVMPETDLHVAGMVAERLRRSIAGEPFAVSKGAKRIGVTISIGLSTLEVKGESV